MRKFLLTTITIILLSSYPVYPTSAQINAEVVTPPKGKGGRDEFRVLKQSTPSPDLSKSSIDPQLFKKTTDTILSKIEILSKRLRKINEKITLRLTKMQQQGIDIALFKNQQNYLISQLSELEKEIEKAKNLSSVFLSGGNPQKDYRPFRDQIILIDTKLKEIKAGAENLVIGMKSTYSVSVTPGIK